MSKLLNKLYDNEIRDIIFSNHQNWSDIPNFNEALREQNFKILKIKNKKKYKKEEENYIWTSKILVSKNSKRYLVTLSGDAYKKETFGTFSSKYTYSVEDIEIIEKTPKTFTEQFTIFSLLSIFFGLVITQSQYIININKFDTIFQYFFTYFVGFFGLSLFFTLCFLYYSFTIWFFSETISKHPKLKQLFMVNFILIKKESLDMSIQENSIKGFFEMHFWILFGLGIISYWFSHINNILSFFDGLFLLQFSLIFLLIIVILSSLLLGVLNKGIEKVFTRL